MDSPAWPRSVSSPPDPPTAWSSSPRRSTLTTRSRPRSPTNAIACGRVSCSCRPCITATTTERTSARCWAATGSRTATWTYGRTETRLAPSCRWAQADAGADGIHPHQGVARGPEPRSTPRGHRGRRRGLHGHRRVGLHRHRARARARGARPGRDPATDPARRYPEDADHGRFPAVLGARPRGHVRPGPGRQANLSDLLPLALRAARLRPGASAGTRQLTGEITAGREGA